MALQACRIQQLAYLIDLLHTLLCINLAGHPVSVRVWMDSFT